MRRLIERARRLFGRDGSAARRRRAWLRYGPMLRIGVGAVAGASLIYGAVWTWRGGHVAATLEAARDAAVDGLAGVGFRVASVMLEGRERTPRAEIAAAVGLKLGDPIFSFDPESLRRRLLALPWIKDAEVERRPPDSVVVRVFERAPFALWQRHGALALVDRDGVVITREGLERFADLVVIVGDDAPKHAHELFAALAREPDLFKRVRAAVHVGKRRWDVRLDNDIDIRLPEDEPAAAWLRLATLERRFGVLGAGVAVVDMRTADWLVIRPRPGSPLGPRQFGKST
jgi:cell division protein FtsQ